MSSKFVPTLSGKFFDPSGRNDADLLRRRRALLVSLLAVAVATLGVLCIAASRIGVPSIERHLRRDLAAVLANDVESLRIDVVGTRVIVKGSVTSTAQRNRVVFLVRGRWGVSSVDWSGLATGSER